MGIFNYIDTFFFISLGITFVLILLLVFHFKQRMSLLEQKNDTMFEIINNIVKEITHVKNLTVMQCSETNRYNQSRQIPSTNQEFIHSHESHTIPIPFSMNENNKILVSDGEDDDNDDDSEENDSEEEDDDSEDDDDDDCNSVYEDDDTHNNIKIINLEMNDEIVVDEIVLNESPILENLGESILLVEKVNQENDPTHDLHILQIPNPITLENKNEISKEIYRKMTLQTLKSLVISKGLSSDPSKLKKNDLLKLLESSLDE